MILCIHIYLSAPTSTLLLLILNLEGLYICILHQNRLGKTHKCFFSGRTTKVLPSLHQWLSGPCHFFIFLSYNSLKRILTIFFFFSPIFGLKQQEFRKKGVFLLSAQGGFTLPTSLVVRPLKKTLFYVCLPLLHWRKKNFKH